jgi:hypothetical protein
MGHAKVDTTLNVYTQVIDGALRTAVDKVGSELFTIVPKPAGSPELIHQFPNDFGSLGRIRTSNPPVNRAVPWRRSVRLCSVR